MTGDGPCTCGYFMHDIPLTGTTRPDEIDGLEYEISPNVFCPSCGQKKEWLHVPTPGMLKWNFSVINKSVMVEN